MENYSNKVELSMFSYIYNFLIKQVGNIAKNYLERRKIYIYNLELMGVLFQFIKKLKFL